MNNLNGLIAKAYVKLGRAIFGLVIFACFLGLASQVSAVTLNTTLPGPSTLILFGSGLVVLAALVRRFRRGS